MLKTCFKGGCLIIVLFSLACSHSNKKGQNAQAGAPEKTKRVKLEREITQLKKEILDLKNENNFLAAAAESKAKDPKKDMKDVDAAMNSGAPMTAVVENEHVLYKKVLEAYESNDEVALKNLVNVHAKGFAKGSYLDDSTYWLGMFYMSRQRYSEALGNFNKILNEFSDSNRLSSALLAKGLIYKKLNLPGQAKEIFDKVAKNYPKSQDAKDAEIQLKQYASVKGEGQ